MIALLQGSLLLVVKLLLCVAAPVVAWKRAGTPRERGLVAAIHVAAMLLLLAGLCLLQWESGLDAFVRSRISIVRHLWLPIVASLLYGMIWAAWSVARSLRTPDAAGALDPIANALRSGLERCTRAGIDPMKTPVYLVLGAPAGGVREFFSSAHVDLMVLPTPDEVGDPIQVCGNRDAIYVCCREASLVSDYARRSAAERKEKRRRAQNGGRISREPAHVWSAGDRGGSRSITESGAVGGSADVAVTTKTVPASADLTVDRLEDTITRLESLTGDDLAGNPSGETKGVLQPRQAVSRSIRLEPSEAEAILERLAAVCRQLSELRQPCCPINGVLMLVPVDATNEVETADHVGMRIERDLQAITAAAEVRVSAELVLCELESSDGGGVFLERFPEDQRHRRLGAVLPVPPESEPAASAEGIERAVHWICYELFPPLGYRLMRRSVGDDSQDRADRLGNEAVQRLVDAMRRRRIGLSRLLRRAAVAVGRDVRIRGCFLAATGGSTPGKHGFSEGILPLLLDLQNEVQWSPERRARDRREHRSTALSYATILLAAAVTLFLAARHFGGT